MPKILERYYPNMESNDNNLIQRPQWDGLKFLGFTPVKWTPDMRVNNILERV